MPNWCYNDLSIIGPKKTISIIKKKLDEISKSSEEESSTIFSTLIGRDEEMYKNDWYSHNTGRYGTKWDVNIKDAIYDKGSVNSKNDEIHITFDTAWSPPIEFCTKLSSLYPDLEIRLFYEESGNDFSGEFTTGRDLGSFDDQYTYYEGLYFLRKESWWESIDYSIQSAVDEESSLDNFIKEHPYILEKDISRVKKMYSEAKKC